MYSVVLALPQWLSNIPEFLKYYSWLVVVLCCVFLAIGITIGYFVGNRSLQKTYNDALDQQRHMDSIQKSIAENVGLGIIVYGKEGIVYNNAAVMNFPGFLKNKEHIPGDLNRFLETYDNKENHLKSDYMISVENYDPKKEDEELIRTNYKVDKKIYEIKILKRQVAYVSAIDEGEVKSEEFDIVIVEDITQIKDDERRQKDLAAKVSHELNTPITVIRASEVFVKKLNSDNKPSYEEVARWGNRILNSAIRMQDIVQDFIVLSMSNHTKQMKFFNIYPVVDKAISNIVDYPGSEKVTIIPPQQDAYPLLFGNDSLIVRIITNLLTNAVKYIDFDGKTEDHQIEINIVTTADKVGIQVNDNGRGIPQKDIDHLFERFYRVDNSGSRDVGGSGLGLAIAKEIAELHDGSINVASKEKEGSTFILFLPTAQSCFERIYEDAKVGAISETPFYRAVTDFFVREEIEAVRSRGYSDVVELIDSNNITEAVDKVSDGDKIKVIAALGDERFGKILGELTYVDEFFDEEDDDEEEEVVDAIVREPRIEDIPVSVMDDEPDPEEMQEAYAYADEVLEVFEQEQDQHEKELERQKKKEVQEFLMQPVVQQSAKQAKISDNTDKKVEQNVNNSDFVRLEDKERAVIHPNGEKKMYNKTGVKLFEGKKKSSEHVKTEKGDDTEPIRSAVRQVLDEASAIEDKIAKNTETEGKN